MVIDFDLLMPALSTVKLQTPTLLLTLVTMS